MIENTLRTKKPNFTILPKAVVGIAQEVITTPVIDATNEAEMQCISAIIL